MSFNFMAAVTIYSDFGAPKIKSVTMLLTDLVQFSCSVMYDSLWWLYSLNKKKKREREREAGVLRRKHGPAAMRNKEDIYPSHFWFCAVKDMRRKSLPGRTDQTPILEPPDAKNWLISEDPDAGKDWRQEEKGTTEDEMVDGTTNSKRKIATTP